MNLTTSHRTAHCEDGVEAKVSIHPSIHPSMVPFLSNIPNTDCNNCSWHPLTFRFGLHELATANAFNAMYYTTIFHPQPVIWCWGSVLLCKRISVCTTISRLDTMISPFCSLDVCRTGYEKFWHRRSKFASSLLAGDDNVFPYLTVKGIFLYNFKRRGSTLPKFNHSINLFSCCQWH